VEVHPEALPGDGVIADEAHHCHVGGRHLQGCIFLTIAAELEQPLTVGVVLGQVKGLHIIPVAIVARLEFNITHLKNDLVVHGYLDLPLAMTVERILRRIIGRFDHSVSGRNFATTSCGNERWELVNTAAEIT